MGADGEQRSRFSCDGMDTPSCAGDTWRFQLEVRQDGNCQKPEAGNDLFHLHLLHHLRPDAPPSVGSTIHVLVDWGQGDPAEVTLARGEEKVVTKAYAIAPGVVQDFDILVFWKVIEPFESPRFEGLLPDPTVRVVGHKADTAERKVLYLGVDRDAAPRELARLWAPNAQPGLAAHLNWRQAAPDSFHDQVWGHAWGGGMPVPPIPRFVERRGAEFEVHQGCAFLPLKAADVGFPGGAGALAGDAWVLGKAVEPPPNCIGLACVIKGGPPHAEYYAELGVFTGLRFVSLALRQEVTEEPELSQEIAPKLPHPNVLPFPAPVCIGGACAPAEEDTVAFGGAAYPTAFADGAVAQVYVEGRGALLARVSPDIIGGFQDAIAWARARGELDAVRIDFVNDCDYEDGRIAWRDQCLGL